MGKRKKSTRKPLAPKKREPLPTEFMCLFCNHDKSVEVQLNKKTGVGRLKCVVCDQKFACPITYLSGPIDVYHEWVDAAEAVAREAEAEAEASSASKARAGRPGAPGRRVDDEEDGGGYEGEGVVPDDDEAY